ncbi:MAG: tetratricopeptide repeat protein [Planctomycetota bacterium]
MTAIRFLTTVSILTLLMAGVAHAQNDRVRTTTVAESGQIEEMSAVAVIVKRGSQTKSVPVNEIESVRFADEPSELTQARLNARNGGYQAALEQLEEIDVSDVSNPYITAEIDFYRAFCRAKLALLGEGDIASAGRDLNTFLQKNSQNFHYLQATELLGDLLASAGRYGPAEQMYGRIAKAPFPEYKVRAAVLIGRALQAQDKHTEALERFEAALAINDDSPGGKTQRLAALLGKAVSLAATGQVDQGVALVEQVLSDFDPSEERLLALTYNALGSCYLQAEKTKDALFAFLHVDLLFSTEPEAHAESLYHLATLWETVGKPAQAREARQTLRDRYAASKWAKQ